MCRLTLSALLHADKSFVTLNSTYLELKRGTPIRRKVERETLA